MFIVHLGENEADSVIGRGSHAPDQEGTLCYQIEWEEVHHGVEDQLHQGDHGQHHPVPQPGEVVLRVLREYGLAGPVDWVDEAQASPEDLPPLGCHC